MYWVQASSWDKHYPLAGVSYRITASAGYFL